MGARTHGSWQQRLRREIGWLLLAKLGALLVLWALFFSPPHRQAADSSKVADRLAVAPETAPSSANENTGSELP